MGLTQAQVAFDALITNEKAAKSLCRTVVALLKRLGRFLGNAATSVEVELRRKAMFDFMQHQLLIGVGSCDNRFGRTATKMVYHKPPPAEPARKGKGKAKGLQAAPVEPIPTKVVVRPLLSMDRAPLTVGERASVASANRWLEKVKDRAYDICRDPDRTACLGDKVRTCRQIYAAVFDGIDIVNSELNKRREWIRRRCLEKIRSAAAAEVPSRTVDSAKVVIPPETWRETAEEFLTIKLPGSSKSLSDAITRLEEILTEMQIPAPSVAPPPGPAADLGGEKVPVGGSPIATGEVASSSGGGGSITIIPVE